MRIRRAVELSLYRHGIDIGREIAGGAWIRLKLSMLEPRARPPNRGRDLEVIRNQAIPGGVDARLGGAQERAFSCASGIADARTGRGGVRRAALDGVPQKT